MASLKSVDRTELNIIRLGIRNVLGVVLLIGGFLFLSAGTVKWLEAWVIVGLFVAYFASWVTWGIRNDPDLLRERAQSLNKDGKDWDKKIVKFNLVISIVFYVVAGFDAVRFGWSRVDARILPFALLFAVLGYVFPLWAMTNNPFATGIVRIQKERGHRVVSEGPYRFVRHPMYVGTLFYGIGAPLYLGSFWALIPGMALVIMIVIRTALEDRTLQEELPGYREYAQKVRFRLIPGIW